MNPITISTKISFREAFMDVWLNTKYAMSPVMKDEYILYTTLLRNTICFSG